MKLLIGYDGSCHADAALEDLQSMGLPEDVQALILSASDLWIPSSQVADEKTVEANTAKWLSGSIEEYRAEASAALEQARSLAQQAQSRVQKIFPSWIVQAEACSDLPARAIIKKAEEWKPDLIVVGARGLSAWDRLWLGSVSEKVIVEAPCSVRVARPCLAPDRRDLRLIIGMDGSPGDEAALAAVVKRRLPAHTEVRVVTALHSFMEASTSFFTPMDNQGPTDDTPTACVQAVVNAAVDKLNALGFTATSLVTEKDPHTLLLQEAEEWQADCIFVGTRSLRGWKRFLLGSVASGVAAQAPCSVEVVRIEQEA